MRRQYFDKFILNCVLIGIVFSIASELIFSMRLVENKYSLIGHLFKFGSIIFVYIPLINGTLTNPYELLFKNINDTSNELRIKDNAMESSLNAIALINGQTIFYVNSTFLSLLGYSKKQEVIGKKASLFLFDQEKEEIISAQVDATGGWNGELLVKRKDKSTIITMMFVNMVYNSDSSTITMCSFQDLTDRKRDELELLKAKKEAEVANEAKSNFLANMSHEIRTPMNGIIGYLHLLEKTPINEEQANYIKKIRTSADILLSVINDILDVSKIEAGKMELERLPFTIHHLINTAITPYNLKAEEKGLKINVIIDDNIPGILVGDESKLIQVVGNLLCNAIKFTETGFIIVECNLVNYKDDLCQLQIIVSDTGIGMSHETISKIFEPFEQADASSTRKYGGTGLGLAICKAIITIMGGEIKVQSEVNKGSTFSFIIPLKVMADEKVVEEKEIVDITPKLLIDKKICVLLVEDNELNRDLFIILLKMQGIECDIAENGAQAVTLCHHKNYDIVFMDCQMPIMDGYEATRKIRENKDNVNTKIVAITADAMKSDIDKCLTAGMNDYLSKPVDISKLQAILNKYI